MPNGGFPINLSIGSSEGELVLIGNGGKLAIYRKQPTKKNRVEEPPLLKIEDEASKALAGFLQYWVFGEEEGAQRSLAAYRAPGDSKVKVDLAL